ncbi:MAG: hypothetical protein U1E53_17075 [Dongiaceae bacterium]
MRSSLTLEAVQLGADTCVELPRHWPCGMRADRSWWCRDPLGRYLIEISCDLLEDADEPARRPLDRAVRRGETLRAELAAQPGLSLDWQPTISGVLLRADDREPGDGGAFRTCWHSLLGFDRSVADSRFTLRVAADHANDPAVAELRDSLERQAVAANVTPAPHRGTLREYRIGDSFVIAMPADWRGRADDDAFWFRAPGDRPKLVVWHHWSDLPQGSDPNAPELGLALAHDLRASLPDQEGEPGVEAAPLGGLVTTFSADDPAEDDQPDDPPLATTAWYYVIPAGGRLLTVTAGLMIPLSWQSEPSMAALPGQFRTLIRELRLA